MKAFSQLELDVPLHNRRHRCIMVHGIFCYVVTMNMNCACICTQCGGETQASMIRSLAMVNNIQLYLGLKPRPR